MLDGYKYRDPNIAEYYSGEYAVDFDNQFQFIVAQSIDKPIFEINQTKSRKQADREYKIRKQRGQLSQDEIKSRQQLEQRQKQKKKYLDSINKYDRNIETDIFGAITFN